MSPRTRFVLVDTGFFTILNLDLIFAVSNRHVGSEWTGLKIALAPRPHDGRVDAACAKAKGPNSSSWRRADIIVRV